MIQQTAHAICQRSTLVLGSIQTTGMDTIGSDPCFYKGERNIAKTLNIILVSHFPDRDEKLAFLSNLFGRNITSTKDLRIGEAMAIINISNSNPAMIATAIASFREQAI